MATIEQITNSSSMSELVLKVIELVDAYNMEQQKTTETNELVKFGSDVLAEILNNKIWCFHSISEFSTNGQLLVGDTVLLLGETFSFWKIIYRSESSEENTTIDVNNPELVAIKSSEGYVTESHLSISDEDFQTRLREVMGIDTSTDGSYNTTTLLSQLVEETVEETVSEIFTEEELEV